MKKFTMHIGIHTIPVAMIQKDKCTNDQDYAILNAKRHHYHHQ